MSNLRDLYQEVILDHYKRPRNHVEPAGANRNADGHNPLCGDKVTIWLKVEGEGESAMVTDIGFTGSGCAISTASASLMSEALKGKNQAEIEALFSRFHKMVTTPTGTPTESAALGKLAVFEGVREFPARIKCASLAWHTLQHALHGDPTPVSTE